MRFPLALLLTTALRLAIWLMLSGDMGRANVMIGLAVALLLPRARSQPLSLRELVAALGRCLLAIPQAYAEALALMLGGEPVEREVLQPATDRPAPLLVFLEVFRITLTPFTIALGLAADGSHYRVHTLVPRSLAQPRRKP